MRDVLDSVEYTELTGSEGDRNEVAGSMIMERISSIQSILDEISSIAYESSMENSSVIDDGVSEIERQLHRMEGAAESFRDGSFPEENYVLIGDGANVVAVDADSPAASNGYLPAIGGFEWSD